MMRSVVVVQLLRGDSYGKGRSRLSDTAVAGQKRLAARLNGHVLSGTGLTEWGGVGGSGYLTSSARSDDARLVGRETGAGLAADAADDLRRRVLSWSAIGGETGSPRRRGAPPGHVNAAVGRVARAVGEQRCLAVAPARRREGAGSIDPPGSGQSGNQAEEGDARRLERPGGSCTGEWTGSPITFDGPEVVDRRGTHGRRCRD